MIPVVQIVVIGAALFLVANVLGRQTYAARAWKKIALSFLAGAMVIAVLFPDLTNQIAHFVGVGRGADLLLYGLTIAFITYALNDYLRGQRDRDALYRLARRVAILEANKRYDI